MAFTNRLIKEKSPYLLQHAHNPVDWYPWGEEAFEKAKQEDKPIFLSIGYATCHWCHVMEEESFMNEEVAKLMNETFVNIKVDREELPEVDSLYMEFAQAIMSGSGGWPLNVILTPDLKPFFAITYLPPDQRKGMIGIKEVIKHLQEIWKGEEKQNLIEQANQLVELFKESFAVKGSEIPPPSHIEITVELFFDLADPVYGGMKGEPKFPLSYQIDFLMNYGKAKTDGRALFYCELTLDMMARGGIYDHLGGGFSRYSIDQMWEVPHFEKMLYDNAIIGKTYVQAWKATHKESYAEIAQSTFDYILREMTHPQGGFFSAQDADTEKHEGLYYTWTPHEIEASLPKEDVPLFCEFFGVTPEGNLEGRSVLHIEETYEEFAEIHHISAGNLKKMIESNKQILFKKRKERPAPFIDDKILTSWNGLMIEGLALAGFVFNRKEYTEAALKAVSFIKNTLWKQGYLLHRWREDEARFRGGLDDYAYLIKGLLTLFETNAGTEWLKWALELAEATKRFKSEVGGYYNSEEGEHQILRRSEFYDGAEPSGNAVMAENFLRLYQITLQPSFLESAEDIFKTAKGFMDAYPPGACYHFLALQRYYDRKAPILIIALDDKKSLQAEIAQLIQDHFSPHMAILWKNGDDALFNELLPNHKDKRSIDGQTALWICTFEQCLPPLLSLEEMKNAIQKL